MSKQSPEIPSEIFKFASLDQYPLKKKIAIYIIDLALYLLIKLIGMTVRYEVEGWKDSKLSEWESYDTARKRVPRVILAFWHNRIFLMTHYLRYQNGATLVSRSFDGEYSSRTAQRFGLGVVRGSSTRGGSSALRQLVGALEAGLGIGLTLDGPLGPRYKVKPGAIALAKRAGVPVVPILIEPKRCWTLNSWDKLQIPKPFTTAKVYIEEPVFVENDASGDSLKAKENELQEKLDKLVERGGRWAAESGKSNTG